MPCSLRIGAADYCTACHRQNSQNDDNKPTTNTPLTALGRKMAEGWPTGNRRLFYVFIYLEQDDPKSCGWISIKKIFYVTEIK